LEEEAWAGVLAAWGDEAVHLAYLAGLPDLVGMAAAGGRYRAVLESRPDDAMASRMREEILRRATALGLATLPRTPPRTTLPLGRKLKLALGVCLGLVCAFAAFRLLALLGKRP
jgi:hypothetical protein